MINKQFKCKIKIPNMSISKSKAKIFCKFKGQFDLEDQGHQIQDLKMINSQLKFEVKIPNGSKAVAFKRIYIKFLSFKANLTLKIKVKVINIQTNPRHLDDQ